MTTTTQRGAIYRMVELETEVLKTEFLSYDGNSQEYLEKLNSSRNALLDILPKIAELEPLWIPVEERLPENWERVLIFNKKWGTDGYKVAQFKSWAGGQFTEGSILRKPTHWQPLPKPPNP